MDYQGNPMNKKENEEKLADKKIEKVITGEVVQKPKGIGHKFKNIFFGGDLKHATRFVTAEVLLPALRNLVVDFMSEGTRRLVYGESGYRRQQSPEYRPRVQYNNPLYRRDPRELRPSNLPDQNPYRARVMNRREANDIILASREEANLVVERLIDIIDKYDVASLADLYDLLGLETSHIDNKWGWTYLNNVDVRQVRNGYLIELPTLEEI